MLLKCLSNFGRCLGRTLIIFKVELKSIKYCIFSTARNDNTNANPSNLIFTIKDIKLYGPVITLSEKDNQKL